MNGLILTMKITAANVKKMKGVSLMEGEFIQFLLKRIGKKLSDVEMMVGDEDISSHIEDINDYISQLTHLITECISWFI